MTSLGTTHILSLLILSYCTRERYRPVSYVLFPRRRLESHFRYSFYEMLFEYFAVITIKTLTFETSLRAQMLH